MGSGPGRNPLELEVLQGGNSAVHPGLASAHPESKVSAVHFGYASSELLSYSIFTTRR
jgi:hypothetical protein